MTSLITFCNVASMRGVDATPKVVERGQQRCQAAGLAGRISFTLADACASGLPSGTADFVWGEDAWCYVEDKPKLLAEAVRLLKPGGLIAFTDWTEGPSELSDTEAERFLTFMKFPNIQNLSGYRSLLTELACDVEVAEETARFAPCMDHYLDMLNRQLTFDALQIIGFDSTLMQALEAEMTFIRQLARANKLIQGIFVARKTR